jgi:hypothetical protein
LTPLYTFKGAVDKYPPIKVPDGRDKLLLFMQIVYGIYFAQTREPRDGAYD